MYFSLLDIILFPRDFTIESNGSIWLDILLNVLSTLGGFGIAWFFFSWERRRERQNEADRLNEVAIYTRAKLLELADGIDDQVAEILKLTKGLKKKRDTDYYFKMNVKFSTTSLSSISRVDLYKLYVSNSVGEYDDKMNKYNRLLNIIDIITELKVLFPLAFRNFIERKEKHTDQWSEAISSLHRAFDTYAANLRMHDQNPEDDVILLEFYRLKYEWSSRVRPQSDLNFRDLYITYDELIMPLYHFIVDHFEDPRSQIFMHYLLECIAAYKNIENIKYFYRKNFILDARRIIKLKARLKFIIEN